MNVHHCPTASEAIEQAAQKLAHQLETILGQNQAVLLLVSGGSALNILKLINTSLLKDDQVTLMVLDERFSSQPKLNNSLQVQALGLPIRLTVPANNESLSAFATRFNGLLRSWVANHPNGRILATLGMGPDGHVAGISPFPESETFNQIFMTTDDLVIGYQGNLSPHQRVTVTPAFLKNYLAFGVALITGEAKRPAFLHFVAQDTKINRHPIQLFHHSEAEIEIFTDLET